MQYSTHKLLRSGLIPWSKSWTIRMGMLDLLYGDKDTVNFLKKQNVLQDDLEALLRCSENWNKPKALDLGESGTLFRFLRFIIRYKNKHRILIKRGTLRNRIICNDYEIADKEKYPIEKLLELDNRTSQWASIAALVGYEVNTKDIPYHLQMSIDARKYRKKHGAAWKPQYDITILKQAMAYLKLFHKGDLMWVPKQPEDYCFARAFDIMSKEAGKKWQSLQGHESKRIEEMEITLQQYNTNQPITSKDHRVVQAIAMKSKIENKQIKILYPESVNKSWPQFWKFLEDVPNLDTGHN